MKNMMNRILSLLLCLMLLMPSLPTALAEAWPGWDDTPATDTDLPLTGMDAPAQDDNSGEGEALPDKGPEDLPEEWGEEPLADLCSKIDAHGHAYIGISSTPVSMYSTEDMTEDNSVFTIWQDDALLLATEYNELDTTTVVKVWLLTEQFEVVTGYVSRDDLADAICPEEDAYELMFLLPVGIVSTENGEKYAFVVQGEKVNTLTEETAPPLPEINIPQEWLDDAQQSAEEPPMENENEGEIPPQEEETASPEAVPDATDQPDDPAGQPQVLPAFPDTPVMEWPSVQVGDFVTVTTQTRAFLGVDESAQENDVGSLWIGTFVRDAAVQIESIEWDSTGRCWYRVRYMYGDTLADGTVEWTDYGSVYVLGSETYLSDANNFSLTDYALPASILAQTIATTPVGFTLRSSSGSIGSFYPGQSGVYGSSGKDSDYQQIAKHPTHGTIYATPHYLNGVTVYCMEHTLPGPGEGSSPSGPYIIVDLDTYMNTPGYSGAIYKESTMHAIAWVLRHTYPFMVLDRSDADNETWSRVAGQFAIREVIKQLEGSQYVRDYWEMDKFYAGSGNAPAVYLEYARWLAENGIARSKITGKINISNKSASASGGVYTGKVTLTTDADLMRIPKNGNTITGNTAGSDSDYYYLNSGDTITVTSTSSTFSIAVESISDPEEEATFFVGVPSVAIQKVLIPQEGVPYALASTEVPFEEVVQYGDLLVTKRRSVGDQAALAGAQFQLYGADRQPIGSPVTTNTSGEAKWTHLEFGQYYVVEVVAPAGYQLDSTWHSVNINSESTITLTVTDAPIAGSVRVVKQSSGKSITLAGAQFELVVKNGSGYTRAKGVDGSTMPVVTTGADGSASWSSIELGEYYVHEVAAPEGYLLDSTYYPVSVTTQGATVTVQASNEIMVGKIRIKKTDELTGASLAGAVFTVTRLSAPSAHNGAGVGEVVATITTDGNGVAETGWLEWGKYRVQETKVPEHFVDNHFSVDVTVNEHQKTYEISVTNEPSKGWIRVKKTDKLDGQPIEGVQFDIFNESGELVSTMTTGADGVAKSEPLHKGKYTVKEHADPEGYVAELVVLEATVTSDTTTDLTATNQPIQGRIRIVKKDHLTKELLAGAEFTITRISGLSSHKGSDNGEVVAVITTNDQGIAETPLLTWGTYRVVETKVPEHFVDNHFSTEVTISENEKTYEIEVENEPSKGWIRLVKTDKLDATPIEGVQFDVFYNDEYGDGLATTMTTDSNGVAMSEPLRKGKYLVKEHADPEGYVAELVVKEATVTSDETTHLSATNQPIQGKIRIVKRDELTKELLAGAEFTVTRVSGLPSHKGSDDGEVVAVIVTDAYGIAETPLLTWGTYLIEETEVPEHFVDNEFSTIVVIDEDNKTYEIEVENEPTKGWLRLTKRDRQNGNPIEGVQFDIYYNDEYGEGLAGTMTTGKDGVAMSEPLRKGRYLIREHGETPGYLFEEIVLEATVRSDEITELEATNRHVTVMLRLYKRDAEEYGGDRDNTSTRGDGILTGAEFRVLAGEDITDRQGNVVYAKGEIVIDSLKTQGADASVTTDELWPGLYEIAELTPPTGYQPAEASVIVDARDAALQSSEAIVTYEGIVSNTVMYGLHAFMKIMGDNEIHDDAGIIETPEAGAEFEFYLKSAGSYENAREFERDYLVTNEYGYVCTTLLPYGVYVLKQVKGQAGYAIKSPIDIFIRGTENPASPPIMTINNEAIRYRLKFIKIDAETGKTILLANTGFRLWDSDGNIVTQTVYYPNQATVDTFYTDEMGMVTLPETVRYGLYFVEEMVAPDGYLLLGEPLAVFVGDDSMMQPGEAYLLEIKIPNEPVKGHISLEKRGLMLTGFEKTTDAYGNEYHQPIYEEGLLAGAVFELRAAEQVTGAEDTVWYEQGELIETLTTTADGPTMSKELPLGRYTLTEIAAPDGYIYDDTPIVVELAYVDDHTPHVEITVTVENEYLPIEASLLKEKEILRQETMHEVIWQTIDSAPGEGFVFGLYSDEDIRYPGGTLLADNLLATGVTDADGALTFSGYYPHGRYYIRELSAPEGWKVNPERFYLTLTPYIALPGETVIRDALPLPVYDELIYTPVTLTKMDITGSKTLPGALIEVTDEQGNVVYRAYTNDDGEIPDIPLVPGRYTFRELAAPEGYALSESIMSFEVHEDSTITGDTTIRDDYTRFTVRKLDDNGQPLAGVEFSLIREDIPVEFTAVTDENGIATFERIPYGDYILRETKPLPGYLPDDTTIELRMDDVFINPSEPLGTWVNHPNEVVLKKTDLDGHPLAGATFGLFHQSGLQIMSAESDDDGTVRFKKIPYGRYTIRETRAPKGFMLSREIIELVVDENYQNSIELLATVANRPKRLRLTKVDTAGKALPGAEFSLIRAATEEIVETETSDEQGMVVFTAIDYGDWIIRETKAPEGYTPAPDIMVRVDDDWTEPDPIRVVNIPNHYEFQKVDNKKKPLAGVKFAIEDAEGTILQEQISGEDGIVRFDNLIPGTYIIHETETVEGFTLSEETLTVTIDEQYTIPTKLPRFTNYPIIQTGVDVLSPELETVAAVLGAGLAATVILMVIRSRGKRRAIRHKRKK